MVVRVQAMYYNNLSSNPIVIYSLHSVKFIEKEQKWTEKRAALNNKQQIIIITLLAHKLAKEY